MPVSLWVLARRLTMVVRAVWYVTAKFYIFAVFAWLTACSSSSDLLLWAACYSLPSKLWENSPFSILSTAPSLPMGADSSTKLGMNSEYVGQNSVITYIGRGFAMGWDYALGWLTVLPFEITAAGITISFWKEINIGVWIAVFLFLLCVVQIFGVRGYGESEFSRSYEEAVIQWLTRHHEQSNLFSAVSKSQPSLVSSFSPSLLTVEVYTPK